MTTYAVEVAYTNGQTWTALAGMRWADEESARQWVNEAWQGPSGGDWPAGVVGMRLMSRTSAEEPWQPLGR